MPEPVASIAALVLGLAAGSFLNVVRYRMPRGEGLIKGRSRCPACESTIAWYDNVPLLSYLFLRGRCRACRWRIPPVYPVLEAGTALAFLLIWRAFPPGEAVAYWCFAAILAACAGIDYDLRIIPDKLTLPGIVLGLVFSLTLLRSGSLDGALIRWLAGVLVGGGSLLLVSVLYKLIRGVEGMGFGDVKLMALVGAFAGWKLALLTIFLGSLVGGIVGMWVVRRSPDGMKAAVPFGVFLSPAAVASLLWGEALIAAYLGLMR
jgi:leader peptidase (prepilin peptidase)/N-methyltransferase